jgi:aminoglycoside phosphotransferase (APT) family kinase protein
LLLDAIVAQATKAVGAPIHADGISIRSGLLIANAEPGLLRAAVGFGSRQIRSHGAALTSLRVSNPPPLVAERVPWLLASGRCGLAEWSLERRLNGRRATHPVRDPLLADCVDFLVALHSVDCAEPPKSVLREQVEIVARAARPPEAEAVQVLAAQLGAGLADLPRGFAHGDFFHGNLLTDAGRLVGVVDWDSAGPGRLPLIDLLHLRYTTQSVPDFDWGPRLIKELLPWARAGGDHIARNYCDRLGFSLENRHLEALVFAYWLDRVSYQLRIHAYRWVQPVWLERNVSVVIKAFDAATLG